MLALLIVLVLQVEPAAGDGETGYTALKFGQGANSYIRFSPDMSPFQNEFSVCSWVKKMRSSTNYHPSWFHYHQDEILMSEDGYYNYIFDSQNDLRSRFTTPHGQWFHQCNAWSLRSRTLRVYLNGVLVGTGTTSSGRTLNLGQSLTIGNYSPGNTNYYFGGELYQLNVYSEELSSSDVKALAEGGPCSGGEELHDDTRLLKWEEIKQKSRTGNVKEIEIDAWGCITKLREDLREKKSLLNHTESRLNATLSELAQTKKEMQQELNSTANDLDETQQQLNSTAHELNETQQQLNSTAHELEEATKQLNSTAHELEEAKQQLDNIKECFQEKAAITQWDLLYSEAFFNKVFTRGLYMKLPSSWDFLEDFVGVRMTDGLINLFKDYHSMKETCTFDPEDAGGET